MINEEHLNLLKDVGAFQRVNQKKFDERLEELRAFKENIEHAKFHILEILWCLQQGY